MSDLQFLQTFYSLYMLRYIVKCLQKLEIWWATWNLLKKNLPFRRKYSAGSNPSCRADGARPKSPDELTIETCKRGCKINREISNLIPIENDISIFTKVKVICTWIWWKLCAECTAIFRIVKNGILTMLKGCVNLQNDVPP